MDGQDSSKWCILNGLVRIEDFPQSHNFCGAALRGIAANHNNVDFLLHNKCYDTHQYIMLQLPHQYLEKFEVVQRRKETYFISKPPTPAGEVVCVVCQSLCTVQVTFIFVHRNTCEGLNVLACTHPLMCVHVCMQYSCTCVHAVLVYMCACSTHVHVCMQYSCTCVRAVLMYMCACSTHVHVCMQYSCTCVHAVLM